MEELGTSSIRYIEPEYAGQHMAEKLKEAVRLRPEDWGDYVSEGYLMRKLLDQHTLLFVFPPATFIGFEVLTGTSKKTFLNVVWAGGQDIDAALPLFLKAADHMAEQFSCEWVEMTGRVGWKRMLQPHGFKTSVVTLRKEPANVLRGRDAKGPANN